jgi:hypothetical protein
MSGVCYQVRCQVPAGCRRAVRMCGGKAGGRWQGPAYPIQPAFATFTVCLIACDACGETPWESDPER